MPDRLSLAFGVVDHGYFCLNERGNPFPQTSAPVVIARMLRALDVHAGAHVLEIGTGSGYSTALLGELVGPDGIVASVDVDPPVMARARSLLSNNGYSNVHVTTGDGRLGWPSFAPYDRVVAWCSVDAVPQAWLDETRPDAILVVPMRSGEQPWIAIYHRSENGWVEQERSTEALSQQPQRRSIPGNSQRRKRVWVGHRSGVRQRSSRSDARRRSVTFWRFLRIKCYMGCIDDTAPGGEHTSMRAGTSGMRTPPAMADAAYASRELLPEFSGLYQQYATALYTYFYHQVGNIEDAEDLTAATFSKVLASFGRYDASRGSLPAWLFGIARNCLRDYRRHPHNLERLAPELPDLQPLPEMRLLSAERAAALQRSIEQLPPDQREALALRFFATLRTKDVAIVLGKSEGAIKMLVHRAVVALRNRAEREGWR